MSESIEVNEWLPGSLPAPEWLQLARERISFMSSFSCGQRHLHFSHENRPARDWSWRRFLILPRPDGLALRFQTALLLLHITAEVKPMKRWKFGACLLITAAIALMSDPSAIAGARQQERTLKIYTTDRNKGGVLDAKITWIAVGPGKYTGSIQGKYEDLQADGYCIQGFKSGGKQRVPLGPPVCPEGRSFQFLDTFQNVSKATVMVCRVIGEKGILANCSGWK